MSAEETTDNFWQAWKNHVWPEIKPMAYRLYYRKDGRPDFYTMEHLPGDYIEVTKEIYLESPTNVRVCDGRLEIIPVKKTAQRLMPNQRSGTLCDRRDVCMVVENDGIYWRVQEHEID